MNEINEKPMDINHAPAGGGHELVSQKRMRRIGLLLVVFGLIAAGILLFLDPIRGLPLDIGLGQIVALVPAILLVAAGLMLIGKSPDRTIRKLREIITHHMTRDVFIALLFAVYAMLFFLGKWEGVTPTPELWSDASTIASFAAAYDHPENFSTDDLLSNPKDAAPYRLFLLPLLSLLTRVTGDYSLSLLILLPVSMFVQLCGFYLLGKKLFKNAWLGLVLSILCAVNIQYGSGDYWGFFVDPQPRFMYQAVLPYLLLLFFNLYQKPKFWPLIMLAVGLAGYIHFLSGPGVAFMIWLGFFAVKPSGFSFRRLLGYQSINAFVYILTFLPILPILLQNSIDTEVSAGVVINQAVSQTDVLNKVSVLIDTYLNALTAHFVLIPFLLSILLVIFFNRKQRHNLVIVSVWLAGILFVSLGLAFIFQLLESLYESMPISINMVRNLRFTIPLLFIVIMFGVEGILNAVRNQHRGYKTILICLLIVSFGIWLINSNNVFKQSTYFYENMVVNEVSCIKTGHIFCPISSRVNASKILLYIREKTPPQDRFLSIPDYRLAEQIRYGALRTSALSIGDSARLVFSNMDFSHLPELYSEYETLVDDDKSKEFDQFVSFACRLDTDYLVSDVTIPVEVIQSNGRVNLEMENEDYTLVKITDCSE